MAQVWPVTLQAVLNEASFGLAIGETVLRSDMDVGPSKTRRRFTKAVDTYSASILLTIAEYSIFRSFYETTLNGGSITFLYNHPITQVLTEFRFKGPPTISSMGGGQFSASFSWESMP